MFLPLAYCSPPAKALYKHLSPAALFDSFLLFLSSYLPCLGGCAHEGGLPRIGPCIAQRGGTIRSTAFGSLTGVFFGTFHTVDSISLFFHHFFALCGGLEKKFMEVDHFVDSL